jgi:hypothetical protein
VNLPVEVLVDEALEQGLLWLENEEIHVILPSGSEELRNELRQRKDEVREECGRRWCRPGVPWEVWFQCRGNA